MSLWHNENIFVILQSGFWVMGDRCWVLAVWERCRKSVVSPLQVRFKSLSGIRSLNGHPKDLKMQVFQTFFHFPCKVSVFIALYRQKSFKKHLEYEEI